jgi:2-oxoglutarate dehydrogenase E1 component
MAVKSDPEKGINSWLEDELYQQYLNDHGAVDESWKHVFEQTKGNGTPAVAAPKPPEAAPAPTPASTPAGPDEEMIPMRGAAARIAENMNASVEIPLATSQRTIPVKVIDENASSIITARCWARARSRTRTSSGGLWCARSNIFRA